MAAAGTAVILVGAAVAVAVGAAAIGWGLALVVMAVDGICAIGGPCVPFRLAERLNRRLEERAELAS
jgi:ABC-type transport system involved in cytochrome bd biosynthesis fused ATPase/permease subunit